jgi:drug/metabolite transporter (DMT)-like permease
VKAGVTLSIALSWVLTTELAAAAQDAGFGGYTLLYFSTSMLSLFRCNGSVRETRLEPRRGGQTAVSWATPGFLVLWLACNLAFMLALTMIRATTVTAVFSTNPAFVYVLSVLILKEPHDLARIFAVLLAVAGVYLTTKGAAHAAASDGGDLDDDDGKDGNGGDDDDDDVEEEESNVVVGALLALLSAALAGLYKVVHVKPLTSLFLDSLSLTASFFFFFCCCCCCCCLCNPSPHPYKHKKVLFYFVFGEATSTQVSAFLGNLGVLNLTVGWVPLLVMWAMGGSAAADMAPPLGAHPGAWLLAALYALASAFFNFRW